MKFILSLMAFLKKLAVEFSINGKSAVAWLVLQVPELTNYPGLIDALESFIAAPSYITGVQLAWQLFFAGATGHRIVKILAKVIATPQ